MSEKGHNTPPQQPRNRSPVGCMQTARGQTHRSSGPLHGMRVACAPGQAGALGLACHHLASSRRGSAQPSGHFWLPSGPSNTSGA